MASANPTISFFIIAAVFLFPLFSSVPFAKSDSNVLKLPSDANTDDICAEYSRPASCPVTCFKTDPVCGVDGVTYWCGCAEALCAGSRVAKSGFCDVGNGGPGQVSGQALLLVQMVWLIVLGFAVLFGLM